MPRTSDRAAALHLRLEELYAQTDRARIDHDPLRFAHRYTDPADAEIAGLIAALYAFGRVDLFLPVLDRLFDTMDRFGGPRRFVASLDDTRTRALDGIRYRWTRPEDLAIFLLALHDTLGDDGRIEDLLAGSGSLRERLGRAITTLRGACLDAAIAHGATASHFDDLPQGVRYLLPDPAAGSACKRWNLYLRWMVRSDRERIDLGLWRSISPAELIIPLDVHVGRLARFLHLTRRTDSSWRTAAEITEALRKLDPLDPVRFDFALAHHGISGACRGYKHAPTCADCAIHSVCRAPRQPTA